MCPNHKPAFVSDPAPLYTSENIAIYEREFPNPDIETIYIPIRRRVW